MAHNADSLREAILHASDPMIVMRRVVEQTLVLVPAATGAAVELADGTDLISLCGTGSLAGHAGTRLRIDASLSGLAFIRGETLYAADCATDERVNHTLCSRVGTRSLICVPLRRERRPIGSLKVCAREANAFGSDDIRLLSALATFISAAIGASTELSEATGKLLIKSGPALSGATPPIAHDLPAAVGQFVAGVLCPDVAGGLAVRDRIARMCAERDFKIVGQPIVDIVTGELLGVEALARFPRTPAAGPQEWFRKARQLGLAVELEIAAAKSALQQLERLPAHAFLAINLGPEAIASAEIRELLAAHPADRVVLELTEHTQVEDYRDFRATIEALRALGTRLAIDDTGAGFSSLAHIANLAPDLIKLDRHFSSGIDHDPARRAVAQSLVSLARDIGAALVAEGVETPGELETIRGFGFRYAQGYLIAHPADMASLPRSFPHVQARVALRSA